MQKYSQSQLNAPSRAAACLVNIKIAPPPICLTIDLFRDGRRFATQVSQQSATLLFPCKSSPIKINSELLVPVKHKQQQQQQQGQQ